MSWKYAAVNLNEQRANEERAKLKNKQEEINDVAFDTVEGLIEAWEKKYTLFHVKKTILIEMLIQFVVLLLIIVVASLASNLPMEVELCLSIFCTILVVIVEIVNYLSNKRNHNGTVYRAIIRAVYTHGMVLSDAERTFIKFPVKFYDVLADEYRGKEGSEVYIVASENLEFVYGIECQGKILML